MKLAFVLVAAINADSRRPRRAELHGARDLTPASAWRTASGTAAIRPAWATMGKPGRSTTDSRFDPIVCSQAASNRSDACSDSAQSGSFDGSPSRRVPNRKRGSPGAKSSALPNAGRPSP
jgi:hypothetical protein